MNVAVTGATCFLGRHIVTALRANGHGVVSLSRRPFGAQDLAHLLFDLPGACPSSADFRKHDIKGLVHCAWDHTPPRASQTVHVNVEGARHLLEAAQQGGVERFIDISTMSAFDGCRSYYGRTKLDVEAMFVNVGGMVLRPGLIWGDEASGMVGTLDGLVRRLPIVPLIGNGERPLFLVHVDDLAELICRVIETPEFPSRRVFTAASIEPMSLRRILEQRGRSFGRCPRFLPIPWRVIWLVLGLLEKIAPGRFPRSDSVLGFVYSDVAPHFETAESLAPGFSGFRRFAVEKGAGTK